MPRRKNRKGRPIAALQPLLSARSLSLGELVDYADNIPADQVEAMALSLGQTASNAYRAGRRDNEILRQLIIAGRLWERLIFEIEGIPKDRMYRL